MLGKFLLVSFFTLSAFACNIQTSFNLFKIESFPLEAFTFTNCDNETQKQILNFFNNSTGVLTSSRISSFIGKEINLNPNVVRIYNMSDTLKLHLNLGFNESLDEIKILNQNSNYIASNIENFKIACIKNCDSTGQKSIKIDFEDANITATYWVNADHTKKSSIYVLGRDVDVHNTSLNMTVLRKKFHSIDEKLSYFNDVKNINFYKPNKKIKKDHPLLKTDLTPVKLVKPGFKVNVLLKSKALTVKSTGIARQAGHFEDFVDLYNPASNKKYTGKVIDYNTVLVEL